MKIETDNHPFDMSKIALNAEQIAALMPFQKTSASPKPKRQSRRTEVEFAMLPYKQTLAAAGHTGCAVLAVLIELNHQVFVTHKNPVALTNSALRSVGISHQAKLRALRQLEAAVVVKVRWRGRRRSPLVTVLWTKSRS